LPNRPFDLASEVSGLGIVTMMSARSQRESQAVDVAAISDDAKMVSTQQLLGGWQAAKRSELIFVIPCVTIR
jgi:hypothetical protein